MKKILHALKRNKLFRLSIFYMGIVLGISLLVFLIERSGNEKIGTYFDAVWFSIVTMTTTGYGEVTPVFVWGRIISIVAIAVGIVLMALLTGTIASIYINRISKKRSGFMKYTKIRDHLIICGWRDEVVLLLKQVIKSGQFSPEKIIIVAEIEQSVGDKLFEEESFYGIKFVRGVSYDKNILVRANAKDAKKALILSDKTKSVDGFDTDSRTVLTVLALKTLNKHMYVCAQLIERDFDIYLQRANCDEIIYSKEIDTKILFHSINNDGMSNVVCELLASSGEADCGLCLERVKDHYTNQKYKEYREYHMKKYPHDVLLGLLENTGRKLDITERAIRDAQKTANFLQMIDNLKRAKSLKPYNPVFVPSDEHVILENSSAIVLRKQYA